MKFVDAKCPNCGQVLKVDSAKEAAICEACGSAFIVEKAVQNFNITNVTHNNVTNVTNVYTKVSDFVIEAGTLTKYRGESPIVRIPNNVFKIGSGAIPDSVTEVYMSDSVEEIHCTFGPRLRKIQLSNNIKEIGCIFNKNCSLTHLQLPSQLEKIKDYAFYKCEWLREISLPNNVKSIGKSAFMDCKALLNVTLNNGLKTIEEEAFSECESLLNVTLNNGLETIEDKAFHRCESLRNIVLPPTLKYIGKWAFSGVGLTSLTIPDSVTKIGAYAFSLKNLQTLTLGKGLTELSQLIFDGGMVKSIKIPRTVTTLSYYFYREGAFRYLEKIFIPQSVQYISAYYSYHFSRNTVICCECKKPFLGNPKGWEKGWSDGAKKVCWGVTEEEFDRL